MIQILSNFFKTFSLCGCRMSNRGGRRSSLVHLAESAVDKPEKKIESDTLVAISLRAFLDLPPYAIDAVADFPVHYSNFYYETSFSPLSYLLFHTKESRILGTSGETLKSSSSKLGDYRWIRRDDEFIKSAYFVVPFSTWQRATSFLNIY